MQPGAPCSGTQAGRVGQQYHRNTGNWGIAFIQQLHHHRGSWLTQYDVIHLRIAGRQLGTLGGGRWVVGSQHVHHEGHLDAHVFQQESAVAISDLLSIKRDPTYGFVRFVIANPKVSPGHATSQSVDHANLHVLA